MQQDLAHRLESEKQFVKARQIRDLEQVRFLSGTSRGCIGELG